MAQDRRLASSDPDTSPTAASREHIRVILNGESVLDRELGEPDRAAGDVEHAGGTTAIHKGSVSARTLDGHVAGDGDALMIRAWGNVDSLTVRIVHRLLNRGVVAAAGGHGADVRE